MTRLSIAALFAVAFSFAANAQVENGVGIVTGSKSGTYIQFGNDMAGPAADRGVPLWIKTSKGSLDNIRRMVSRENAAAGVVQSDVLGFLGKSSDPEMRRVAKNLRLVFPFYDEEVHLFATKEVKTLSDLNGKRVVLGSNGSGNWLTATNILHLAGIEPSERLRLSPVDAATAILTGKADAMFFVGGKPVKLFSNFNELAQQPDYQTLLNNVHMVPLGGDALLKEYGSGKITRTDYSWMEQDVDTVAVKAVLVAFDFSKKNSPYYNLRCNQLDALGQAIREALPTLASSGHPKWKEVDLDQNVGIWEQDTCSRRSAVASASPAEEKDDFLIKGLKKCIETGECK